MAQVQFPYDAAIASSDPDLAGAQLNYTNAQKALQYRQDLAKSLLADSEKPYSSGIGARGMAYRVSPWEGLAHAVSGGAGAYMTQQNVEQEQENARKYGQAILGVVQPRGANPTAPNGGFVQGNNTGQMQPIQGSAQMPAAMGWAVDQLKKEGVPEANARAAAAHLVGQAHAESGLNPDAPHDGGIGYGIYGATGQRRENMTKWLKENGYEQNSTEGQMRYMAHEAMTDANFAPTRQVLMNASPDTFGPQSAVVTGNFERPKTINDRSGAVASAYSSYNPEKPLQDRLGQPNAAGGVQQPANAPIYHIPGMDDRAAHALWIGRKEEWSAAMAASIRANAPSDIEKAVSHLPPEQRQMVMTAYAKDKSGLINPKEGTQLVPGPNGTYTQQAIPGAAVAKGEMKGAEAASEKAGAAAGNYPEHLNERAENASSMLRSLTEMKNLNTNPGMFAGVKEDVGKFFRSMGASDETIQKYLKVSPGNLEASQKLTAQMATESVRQISNRPTQVEFQKFLEANPNIFQTPEGLKRVTQFLSNAANDTLNEQKGFLAWKPGRSPSEYNDYPAHYNQARAEAIRRGEFNSTPLQAAPSAAPTGPQAPGQPAGGVATPSPAFAEGTKKVIGGQEYVYKNGQWGRE